MDLSLLKKAFATNKQAEADGVWVDYDDAIRVKLRRDTHPIYRKAIRRAYKRFKNMGGNLTPEQEDMVKDAAVANGLITDWNVGSDPFTPENALEAFKAFPDFRRWCEDQAGDVDLFKEGAEDDAGNSSASSHGSDSGEALQA